MAKLYDYRKLILVGIVIIVSIIAVIVAITGNNKLVCTYNKKLYDGFDSKEKVVFKLSDKKVKSISLNKSIEISRDNKLFVSTVEELFKNGYRYLDANISTKDEVVSVSFITDKKGIILDNVSIKSNSKNNKENLRFDILNDIDKEKNSIKINDTYSKHDLKERINKLGYTCK